MRVVFPFSSWGRGKIKIKQGTPLGKNYLNGTAVEIGNFFRYTSLTASLLDLKEYSMQKQNETFYMMD